MYAEPDNTDQRLRRCYGDYKANGVLYLNRTRFHLLNNHLLNVKARSGELSAKIIEDAFPTDKNMYEDLEMKCYKMSKMTRQTMKTTMNTQ